LEVSNALQLLMTPMSRMDKAMKEVSKSYVALGDAGYIHCFSFSMHVLVRTGTVMLVN